MSYNIQFSENVIKELKKLDKYTQKILIKWIEDNLQGSENPRAIGKALVGNHSGEWRYRIGDYRIIVKIEDNKLIILVIALGHRKDIYK